MYRQGIPGLGVSIEQATERVPADGRYYVISQGVIQRGYRSLRDATLAYDRLRVAKQAEAAGPVEDAEAAPTGAPEAGGQ
ncbi:MAG: hypothetical protein AB7U23_16405 [Dehalococcoidia bacterium]